MASKLKVEIEASAQDFISNMNKASKSVDDVKKQTDKTSDSINNLGNQCNSASQSFSQMSNAEKKAVVEALNHERATRQQAKAIKEAQKELKEMQSSLSGIGSSISSAFRSLQSGDLMGFTDSIKNAGINFKNLSMGVNTGQGALSTLSSSFNALGGNITKALGPLGIAAASVAAVTAVTYKAVSANQEYHASLGEFSALTGMVGADLDDMGDRARDMAVKFGSSAPEILNSMKLIGSQAPILLKDADAMEQVTDSAIVLSKASKMSIEDSARGITTIINQMGADVNESKEIINSLAAGSKEGAGDVNYLSTAIEKSGTIAAGMGLSFQEVIGTIETLAPKFSSAEVAGTALKGTLLKLSTQANSDFNPAVVGLSTALQNLADANLSDAELTKLVGEANITATRTLIDERSEVDRLTNAVTGTNTAFDQMEAQGGLLSQTWDKLCASVNDLWIELGETNEIQAVIVIIGGLIKTIQFLIDAFKYMIKIVNKVREITLACFKKIYDYCLPYIQSLYGAITNSSVYKFIKNMWETMYSSALDAIKKVKDIYRRFMSWLGLSKEDMTIDANLNVKGKKDVKGDYQKRALAQAQREALEEQKKAEKNAQTKARKEYESEKKQKERDAQKKINDAKIEAEKIQESIESLTQKKIINQDLHLDTSSIDTVIAKLQEKLIKQGEITGDKFSDNMIKVVKTKLINGINDILQKAGQQKLNIDVGLSMDVNGLEQLKESVKKQTNGAKAINIPIPKTIANMPSDEREQVLDDSYFDVQDKFREKWEKNQRAVEDYNATLQDRAQSWAGLISDFRGDIESCLDVWDRFNELADDPDANDWDYIGAISQALGDIVDSVPAVVQGYQAISQARQALASANVQSTNQETQASLMATGAEAGKALMGATSSGASIGFPQNLVAIAAGVSAVLGIIAMIANIRSKAQRKATGGIVQGSTHNGDNILTRLNAGEMVLNQRQQKHMFKMLDKGTVATSNAQPELSFRIKGEDLVGAIKNYNNKHK